ncbi:MAG TPA: ATP-dependent chaperone ClpB, partial [Alphaproteobacteria bacterium]|nr:ATP-dependent chaperone ClpB [Alphaproteobacteria bacterium]
REQVMGVVRKAFRPEFLNRLDEILLFRRLGRDQMSGIVDIQLRGLQRLLVDRRVTLRLTEAARGWLAERGYDPAYGARPLKRAIQTNLQNALADMILKGEIPEGSTVEVGVKGEGLSFNVHEKKRDAA